jgi:NAD(P)-dependent dehydrogenase (short-subunit alcohol dehydrogenase family)
MDTGLYGKTILVTGATSGIGKATARAFGREAGARVALTYFRNEKSAKDVVASIEQDGGSACAVYLSLADHASIEKAVDAVAQKFGGIDVLVNNAVYSGTAFENMGKAFEDMPSSQWEETVGVNLFGTVKVTQCAVPFMRRNKWGRIINVSADISYDSMRGAGPYGSLRTALFGLTSNLVEELSADGILSNVVLPSWTLVERAINNYPEEFRREAGKAFPTNRVTVPEDVATLIVYLGSAANRHVNGEHIRVTGKGSQPLLNVLLQQYRGRQAGGARLNPPTEIEMERED